MSGWRKRQIAELMEEVQTDTSGRWVSIDEVKRVLEKCFEKTEGNEVVRLSTEHKTANTWRGFCRQYCLACDYGIVAFHCMLHVRLKRWIQYKEFSMIKRDIVLQVKELVERHLDVIDIAHRLHMDVPTVMSIIEVIKQSLS